MGGMHGFGAVVTPGSGRAAEHPWELRVFALSTLVGIDGLGAGSGRAIREEMEPAEYLAAGYYERWLWSTEQRLLRRGTLGEREVDGWVERLRRGGRAPTRGPGGCSPAVEATGQAPPLPRADARFAVGDRVRTPDAPGGPHALPPLRARSRRRGRGGARSDRAFRTSAPTRGPRSRSTPWHSPPSDLFGPSDEGEWTVLLDLFESYLEPA